MQFNTIEIIVYLIGNFFRIYIIAMLFNVFFKAEGSRDRRNLRIAGYILFYIINSAAFICFSWPPQIIMLTNIVGTTAVALTYTGTWKYRICAVLLSIATCTICEDLLYYLIVLLEIEHILVIGIIAADILFFMTVLLLQKAVDFKNKVDVPTAEWAAVIVIPVISLIISTMVLDKCRDEIAVAVGQICLVLVNILFFFLLDKIQTAYRERLDIGLLQQQNQTYENQIQLLNQSEERISALRHDLRNHLFTLAQLAAQSNSDAVKEYLQELLSDAGSADAFSETGNFVIDSFMNAKLTKAKNAGTDIDTELAVSGNINMEDKDISIVLGNLLDNAVRAVETCPGPRRLTVVMRETPGKLYLKIENTHGEFIQKRGNRILSSKADSRNHGIGLKNVQKVVDKYNGNMEVVYTEDVFTVKLIMFI